MGRVIRGRSGSRAGGDVGEEQVVDLLLQRPDRNGDLLDLDLVTPDEPGIEVIICGVVLEPGGIGVEERLEFLDGDRLGPDEGGELQVLELDFIYETLYPI